jgi:metal-dependent amidase/aminoacylase/carboxypeptidase family protein
LVDILGIAAAEPHMYVAAGLCVQTNSDADNIIPDHVTLRGTLRALTHEHMMLLKQRIEEAVPAVVSAFR